MIRFYCTGPIHKCNTTNTRSRQWQTEFPLEEEFTERNKLTNLWDASVTYPGVIVSGLSKRQMPSPRWLSMEQPWNLSLQPEPSSGSLCGTDDFFDKLFLSQPHYPQSGQFGLYKVTGMFLPWDKDIRSHLGPKRPVGISTIISSITEKLLKRLGNRWDLWRQPQGLHFHLKDHQRPRGVSHKGRLDKAGLPGRFKAWIDQHSILSRILWLLLVCEGPDVNHRVSGEEDQQLPPHGQVQNLMVLTFRDLETKHKAIEPEVAASHWGRNAVLAAADLLN